MTTKEVQSPRGVTVTLEARDDTTDLATIGSTFRLWDVLHDEYGLADIYSEGLLVDVGAHIGTVAIAFLIDNPKARAVAVEPLPENVVMIHRNAQAAGVSDRLTVLTGAIGADSVAYGPDVHRFIANLEPIGPERVQTERISLSAIVERFGPIAVLKTDCEGCEWSLFDDPAIADVGMIVGEYHQRGPKAVQKALRKSHKVTADTTPTGGFTAVQR